ncbi:MAG: ABC transporter permease subunit [Planctomycetota bacterium]
MNIRDTAGRLQRAQRTRSFKTVASAVLGVIALVLIVGAVVQANRVPTEAVEAVPDAASQLATETITNATTAQRMMTELIGRASTPTGFILSVLVVTAVLLVTVWLGVGLTYLGLLSAAAVVIVPMAVFASTRPYATFAGGISSLALAFTVLLQGASLLLSGKGPVFAIAKNVLAEAVRLKLSLVFIVLLLFGLAALPGLLDGEQPLRYRVQSFMQYGTGGTFWLIAVLVVAFSVSTVASEQRDKVIWQTITKPVAAWQYVLGKWLGVSTLAALLLAVNSAGVFLFVEYLRNQPAQDEREAFVAMGDTGISEDRLILESEILTARRTVYVTEPPITDEVVRDMIAERVEIVRERDPAFELTQDQYDDIDEEIRRQWRLLYFAVPPGQQQTFVFEDVGLDPDADVPVTLHWRIDAGANRPDQQFRIGISVANSVPVNRTTALGFGSSIRLTPSIYAPPQRGSPLATLVTSDEPEYVMLREGVLSGRLSNVDLLRSGDLLDENGDVRVTFVNGESRLMIDQERRRFVGMSVAPNPDRMQFPAGSLRLSYAVGSYHTNFVKSVFVLWIKLAFLAMLGITAATFLSFSVASMVSFGVFLIAESAPFIKDALATYATINHDQEIVYFRVLISAIAHGVSWLFLTYGELSPVERLVAGENVSLAGIARGMGVVAVWIALLYGVAVQVFRKRELAIYSGH